MAPQTREHVVDEFCDALDEWLGEASGSLELTDSGRARFAQIIGELLDNAERHSDLQGKDGSWSLAAFMALRSEGGQDVYRCHLGFLSGGATIAESLATASQEIINQVDQYCNMHRKSGISRDTLATIVALQDGITRDVDAYNSRRGGVGFQDVFEFVSLIGATRDGEQQPRMTILSGSSCIQLRAPYVAGVRDGTFSPRMIWFNEANDPALEPSQEFVFDLDHRIDGTIIGITFVLNADDLMGMLHDEHPSQ